MPFHERSGDSGGGGIDCGCFSLLAALVVILPITCFVLGVLAVWVAYLIDIIRDPSTFR
jgi:hypothetical protein